VRCPKCRSTAAKERTARTDRAIACSVVKAPRSSSTNGTVASQARKLTEPSDTASGDEPLMRYINFWAPNLRCYL
jgi:hypothetical protein